MARKRVFYYSRPYTLWSVHIHTIHISKKTYRTTSSYCFRLCFVGGWCHGEEEARALEEEVHSRLFSLHCWVMILHRPHGQHAASQQLCVCMCDWMVCAHEGETVSVIPRGGGVGVWCFVNDLRLPLTAVCICVYLCLKCGSDLVVCVCALAAASGASLTCSYSTCHQPSDGC